MLSIRRRLLLHLLDHVVTLWRTPPISVDIRGVISHVLHK